MRFPRPTVRIRLTLLYGSLFLLAGIVLLVATHVLYREALDKDEFEEKRAFYAEEQVRAAFGDRLPSGKRLREFTTRDGRTIFKFVEDVNDKAIDDAVDDALREQLAQSGVAGSSLDACFAPSSASPRPPAPLPKRTSTTA